MYYCFVQEELEKLREDDPLLIQARYAKRLGRYCCCRLQDGSILDQNNKPIYLKEEMVILRSSYKAMSYAIESLTEKNIELLEKTDDIAKIERWEELGAQKRQIFSIKCQAIINDKLSMNVKTFLSETREVFIKSRKKGFSVLCPSEEILKKDSKVLNFLERHCRGDEELLLSEKFEIKEDSLGVKESRHMVINGKIMNSSRPLHSVKHAVPKSLLMYAECLVDFISDTKRFPENYVLDVGEFVRDGSSFIDVIEINPLTCSMCYVNNSIFDLIVPEIVDFRERMHMGAEYCYDALESPERYVKRRYAQTNYSYVHSERYHFF